MIGKMQILFTFVLFVKGNFDLEGSLFLLYTYLSFNTSDLVSDPNMMLDTLFLWLTLSLNILWILYKSSGM